MVKGNKRLWFDSSDEATAGIDTKRRYAEQTIVCT